MPALGAVSNAARADLGTAGGYLRAMRTGSCEPADIVVVPVGADGEVIADDALDATLAVPAKEIVSSAQLTGKAGQHAQAVVRVGDATVKVVFMGFADRSAAALRKAGGELGRMLRSGETAVTAAVADLPPDLVRAFAEAVILGSYRYSEKSAADGEQVEPARLRLLGGDGATPEALQPGAGAATQSGSGLAVRSAVGDAAIFASAAALARDLSNTPSVRKSPQWLADAAVAAVAGQPIACRVRDERELTEAGFGAILAVGSGSDRPPRLIELRYEPDGAQRHVVLVGKGITFDSGGLSLKPNDGMKAMKTDMAGGAAVIAVMSALARLGVSVAVTGLVAAAENMPSGAAYRPGDVVTAFNGRTIEVLNTDAEGRLVLADAIAYANAELAPNQIVDVATLTGAARIALGGSRAALYATDDALAAELIQAGEASGERLWRMPLADDYRRDLDSPVADLANVSRGEAGAGSVVAALFLREFAGATPWAHLDIAGAARCGSDDGELTAGATGFGTRLLLSWLAG